MAETGDRGREAVRGALGAIAGALGIEIPNATEYVWLKLFGNAEPERLKDAVCLVLDKWQYGKVPPPSLVREALTKLETREAHDAVRSIVCHDCDGDGLGLVSAQQFRHGEMVEVIVPCPCAIGQSKQVWLNQERRRGRADNRYSASAPTRPEEDERVPF